MLWCTSMGLSVFLRRWREFIDFCKKLLWLPTNTPNYMILAELGRNSVNLFTTKIHLDFIDKTLKADNIRYINVITKHMILHKLGWVRWYLDVATRFSIIDNDTLIQLSLFELSNCYLQHLQLEEQSNIQNNIYNAQKHLYYKDIIEDITDMKSYLNTDFKVTDMRIIANIRCEGLQVFGRPWAKVESTLCKVCNINVVEDVVHFLGECLAFERLCIEYFNKPLLLHFEVIDIIKNSAHYHKLVSYMRLALKIRKDKLEI